MRPELCGTAPEQIGSTAKGSGGWALPGQCPTLGACGMHVGASRHISQGGWGRVDMPWGRDPQLGCLLAARGSGRICLWVLVAFWGHWDVQGFVGDVRALMGRRGGVGRPVWWPRGLNVGVEVTTGVGVASSQHGAEGSDWRWGRIVSTWGGGSDRRWGCIVSTRVTSVLSWADVAEWCRAWNVATGCATGPSRWGIHPRHLPVGIAPNWICCHQGWQWCLHHSSWSGDPSVC